MDHLPTHGELPEKPITPVLSPHLKQLLAEEPAESWAVRAIWDDPELRAEAIAQLPVLKAAATQRAGDSGVRAVIGKRFAMYPQPDRSEGEWLAWWEDYYEALSDLPWAALEAGMLAYVRDGSSEFMPKPGKLRDLARSSPAWVMSAYSRARRVADYEPPKVYDNPTPVEPPPLRTMSQADTNEAIRKMHADFLKAQTVREAAARPNVELPSTAGKPDAGGLTPQMRELMARRSEDGRG